ncbi:unnamed protein product [Clonostachys rosea]|uniref:Uncharacterized protein n=1 Tax=Bionectria ochroleuca TaxID=29856 RepID=A0ABY6U4G1_BIOOC|nr:unnamed protein product [Clonostachys rosea]
MATMAQETTKAPYNNYFIPEKDLKYVPPYFRDVPETPKEVKCVTAGNWPKWLEGSFLRSGTGRWTVPLSEDGSKPNAVFQHFFDGLNMLHKFRMIDGQVFYTSRYTTEGIVRNAKKNGFVTSTMFGLNANIPLKDAQDPCSALLGAQQSLFMARGSIAPDEVNVNVCPRRGMHLPPDRNPISRGEAATNPEKEEIIMQSDFNMIQTLDAKTLEPKRILTYAEIDPQLAGLGICAHPPKDRARGMTFNYLISPDNQVLYIFALDIRSNPVSAIWKTALPCKPCYTHSIAMTDKYVVFIRNPVHMNVEDLTKPVMEMFEYEPNVPTQFFVLDKLSGKHDSVASYALKGSFFFFHCANAYDYVDSTTGNINVHVDICSYDSEYPPFRDYNLSNIVDPAAPFQNGVLRRYELGEVDNANPDEMGRATIAAAIPGMASEVPRIAKSASMDPNYRYVYSATGYCGDSPGTSVPIGRLGDGYKTIQAAFFGSLAKSDWKTGTFKEWKPPNGESNPCEPIFVQRPGATEEDDGIVLSIVIDKKGHHSILVALDGKTFEETARAHLPQVYALGPHGTFVEGDFGA